MFLVDPMAGLPKIFFGPFGPHFGRNKGGGPAPPGPSHGSATDIDGIITEFARLKGTHLALCL